MKTFKKTVVVMLTSLAMSALSLTADAAVPIRISVKFILDANGDRPATGNMNTDAEVLAEINEGISILASTYTEFEIDTIRYTDLAGVSQWFNSTYDPDFWPLYNTASGNPATYLWDTDAINMYINNGASSAAASYPPDNRMIFMHQFCGNTPSCVLHEMGHNLHLIHTHESDGCSDTLPDNSGWNNKDQMAQNSFGLNYADLTPSQQDQVDRTWHNVMSYHTDSDQRRLTLCQKDRASGTADDDRTWLLSKLPIYVDLGGSGIFQFGTFDWPYLLLQSALNAGGLSNNVLVLEQGTHVMGQQTINDNVEMVTRTGSSTVTRGVQKYSLPTELHNSENTQMRDVIRGVQKEDTKARNVMKNARAAAKSRSKEEAKQIIADAKTKQKQHDDNALKQLHAAEKLATGDERLAIQLELAQRYRYAGSYAKAAKYYGIVADATDQEGLIEEATHLKNKFLKKSESQNKNGELEEQPLPENKKTSIIDNSDEN